MSGAVGMVVRELEAMASVGIVTPEQLKRAQGYISRHSDDVARWLDVATSVEDAAELAVACSAVEA